MKKVINLFNNNIVPNEGVKYSVLLEKFIAEFEGEFEDFEFMEDIFEFGIMAWNFGNMSLLVPKEEFKKIIAQLPKQDVRLFKRMIAYKVKEFRQYTNFMVDFELKETIGDPILSVVTETEEDNMARMMEAMANEPGEGDFEEGYINRSAIIVKPLQPFLDWYYKLYPEDKEDEADDDYIKETNIFLVKDEITDVDLWLKKKFDTIFKLQLEEYHTNKKEWPQNRTHKMFNQWFQVSVSNWIYDLERKPVYKLD